MKIKEDMTVLIPFLARSVYIARRESVFYLGESLCI
jgi:hypothetical protein